MNSTVPLGLGRIKHVRPQGIVADERRAERVLMVLGIVGEELYPGVAVEVDQRFAVCLEQVAGGGIVDHHVAVQALQQQLADPVAVPAAHDEHGVAASDRARQRVRGRLDRARGEDRIPGVGRATASARPAAEAIVVSGSRPAQMSATATASAPARASANASSIAAVRWYVSGS